MTTNSVDHIKNCPYEGCPGAVRVFDLVDKEKGEVRTRTAAISLDKHLPHCPVKELAERLQFQPNS